ncbi:DNA phosphorothioation-associated putative methyltransferase [Synechocystis sp. PCC 7509]|uniref:DNA phosphorothioation-associated putative methyltransferase n=1 Tax=Synechocystis sp. PCC 7509 TaxID=927677 RepID=UPI0002ACEA34|nr:DNA phosphorothioation-associated putative methyltransferase [Synechocystis sp. PCC 7509]
MYSFSQLGVISELCQHSEVGKLLPSALYVHISALPCLDPLLQSYEQIAKFAREQQNINIVKFSTDKLKISYLYYPDFDSDPHPALQASIVVDLKTLETSYRDYRNSDNPPILHRKETFVTRDYPLYEQFAALTRREQALGLLSNTTAIGTRLLWEQRLELRGVELQGHSLILHPERCSSATPRIERHKAAIARTELSRPVRLALEANLFSPETTFFDYGCGYGGDISCINKLGYSSTGWDPHYSPDTPRIAADIVNLGYVINVIEDTKERREALIKAWELTRQVLIVSAQVLISDRTKGQIAYGDGVVTRRNTFQKYYEQEELKIYIEQVLGLEAIPVALGIYFVFQDPSQAQSFRASRYRSRATTPKIRVPSKRFEDYQELLTPLMNFISDRGRLPVKSEIPQESQLLAEFHSFKRAFQVILQATDALEWEAIAQKRREDLLVYFALSKFSYRPKLADLKPQIQEDIKALFGSYKQAIGCADQMLFSVGNLDIIAQCCQKSEVGHKLPNSLTIHVSSLESLNPLLRLYEGCASRTIGRMDSANVIKFHTKAPKISYYFYPDFDSKAHPTLSASMQIDLRDLQAIYTDYDGDYDPPVLHQKDTLVTCDYPHYAKFAKLSDREQDWGLLDNWHEIKRLQGWQKCLIEHCATIDKHQLRWSKDADPYKLKLLRSAISKKRANSKNFFNT